MEIQRKTFSDYVKEFEIIRLREILKNGELYMFDSKLTKEEHDKIVRDFEKIVSEQNSDNQAGANETNQNEIEKVINIKNFS